MDTFPKILRHNAQALRDHVAAREKDLGIWQSWTWAQVYDEVRLFALGLHALGLRRGQKLAIVGDNRPRLYWTFAAAQSLGAVPVPVYQDSVAKEMAFVIDHGDVTMAVVEDQEQVDKMMLITETVKGIKHIVYDDPRGLDKYDKKTIHSFEDVQALGAARLADDPSAQEWWQAQIDQGKGSDAAVILYTSGTTGNPKGVVLSYDNLVITARNAAQFDGLTVDDEVLAYLPMAWVGDHVFSYAQSYVVGFCVSCPESPETMMQDLLEIGPSYFFAPPRIFENILTSVMVRMEDASKTKQKVFQYFLKIARRVGEAILNGEPVGVLDRLIYGLGEIVVFGPLKNTLGLSRVRIGYTAGEAIGPEIFSFYRSLGINLKQLYGQTESSVFITAQPDGEIFADTVGVPAPGVEVEIADNGEVLYRSPGVFQEYYKNPDATTQTKTKDGWVHTGDAGYFDDVGHLKIIDRSKDVGKLKDGTLFAPKFIENKLKFFPNIKEAVAFGAGKDFCAVFINIDLVAMGSWAERNNVAYASYQELAAFDTVYNMIADHIDEVNADLATDPHMAGSQIARFLILHKELDADDGELTRTRKVRRTVVAERYQGLIDGLFSGAKSVDIKSEVTFEDGRRGRISATLVIRNVKTQDAASLSEAAE
ncbi:MAG: AMP-binding protein [Alphaproteobacteria bacterium]